MVNPVSQLKDKHRQLAFGLLSRRRKLSRVEIARELGVSLQTGMKIMEYFTDYGIASYAGDESNRVGRKPRMFVFNPDAAHILAAVNEGSVLRVGVLNLACEPLLEETSELRGGVREMLVEQPCAAAERLLRRLAEQGRRAERLLGVGVCLPGVVDDERRAISFAPNFTANASYQIGELLDEMAAHMNAPVLIENDVNAAVYGELSRQSAEDLVFLSVGSGVGMGLVLDGKLRRGPQFTAGEIGMVPYGEPTAMGLPRSVEGYIGLDALKRRFGFDRQFGAQAMDPDARAQMVGSLADVLGHIIAVTSALLNVSDFVLGGLTPDALGEELFEAVRRRAGALSPFPVALRGQSLNSPTLVGAARRVMDAQIGALLALDGEKNGKREELALSSGNRESIDEKES